MSESNDETTGSKASISGDLFSELTALASKWRTAAGDATELARPQTGAAATMLLSEARIYRKLAAELEALISENDAPTRPAPTPRTTMTPDDLNEVESSNGTAACAVSRAVAGSTSVGPGQRAAALVWDIFKERELCFIDLLELAAVVIVNVADKTEASDDDIHGYVRRLTVDMRERLWHGAGGWEPATI